MKTSMFVDRRHKFSDYENLEEETKSNHLKNCNLTNHMSKLNVRLTGRQ